MELYLLRHGIAESRTHGRDSDRALTREGIDKMRRSVKGMHAIGLTFDRILTSPLVRARQTAELVTEQIETLKKLEVVPDLAAGADPSRLLSALKHQYAEFKKLLLVGHEPDLSLFASRLLLQDGHIPFHFKKGSLCKLEVPILEFASGATLEWLLTPNQLAHLSGRK